MIKLSKYAKEFISVYLTQKKYEELKKFSMLLLELRNDVSQILSDNLFFFLEMSCSSFVTYMRKNYHRRSEIPSSFDYQLYSDVYIAYSNKINAILKNLKFEKITLEEFVLYKKNGKNYKAGDLKSVKIKRENTPLASTLTYLTRYGSEDTIQKLEDKIKKELEKEVSDECTGPDTDKIAYWQNVIDKCDKFGFDKLFTLALQKRNRILDRYIKNPVVFKSLTFRGKSRKKKIIDYNDNYNSVINAFITLSNIPGYKSFSIPVKFNKDYHGKMKEYLKKVNEYEYVIKFDDKHKRIKIVLVKDGERCYSELVAITDENTVGIDVNVKHNMFTLSDGTTYDYKRKLVKKYFTLCRAVDERKKKDKDYATPEHTIQYLSRLEELIKIRNRETITKMCSDLKKKNITHIAMENLDGAFRRNKAICEEFGVRYTRLERVLNISSLKDEVTHIANNYGIVVSFVNPAYTSQRCPVCGCIDSENRDTQEEFECVDCGHKSNADLNAAINIKDIVVKTVLNNKLLKANKIGNGGLVPKTLKREKVKDTLLSCRKTPTEVRNL